MEATWMESNCKGIFGERVGDFQGLSNIIPNLDSLVLRTGYDQLLSNAHVKSSNLLSMKATVNKIELGFLI